MISQVLIDTISGKSKMSTVRIYTQTSIINWSTNSHVPPSDLQNAQTIFHLILWQHVHFFLFQFVSTKVV